MRIAASVAGCLLLGCSALVQAHAHLQQSTPVDGSTLSSAPGSLVLRFSEAARLTALWIQRSGGTRQRVTPLPDKPQATISVTMPQLEPGSYLVSFRVLSDDGHVVPGQIHFTLTR
jgi:methionine-rich copper-binding protein CopC